MNAKNSFLRISLLILLLIGCFSMTSAQDDGSGDGDGDNPSAVEQLADMTADGDDEAGGEDADDADDADGEAAEEGEDGEDDEDDEDDLSQSDPIQRALQTVRGLVEEERGSPIIIIRWRFYQDNWSTQESWRQYGSFGIDNCREEVLMLQKRSVLFGWTFIITELSGKRYQGRVSLDLQDSVLCDEADPPLPSEVAAAAEAAAEVQAALPPAIAAGSAGAGGFSLGGHVEGLTGQAVELMRSAGMTWVKKQLPISAGINKGHEFITAAHANGFKILLGIVGDKNALAADFDAYVTSYTGFVAQMARAGADAIEIWNEPNIDREWPAGEINGASYTKLLSRAYNAIKTANSSTIVISGAPAPTGFFGTAECTAQGCNDDAFMRQMASAGAANYMDCLGLHYNEGIVSPKAYGGDPRDNYPTRYFGAMLNRGAQYFPNEKICWTELGYLSGEGMGAPIPGGFAWAQDVTVAQQAQWLAEAATLSAQNGRVLLMIVWNVNFSRWDSDPMGGYAMLRPDGSCPACGPLKTVMG